MQNQSALQNSVKYVKGVGPKRAELLNKLGIYNIGDLLSYYPRDYEDRREIRKIVDVRHDEKVVISGKVKLADVVRLNKRLGVFKVAITDSTGIIYGTSFRAISYRYDAFAKLRKDFKPGAPVIIYGKVANQYGVKEIAIDEYDITGSEKEFTGIFPVYPATEGVNNTFLRKLIKQAVDNYLNLVPGLLPDTEYAKYALMPGKEALKQIHFPADFTKKESARKRLAYDEFLLLELAMLISKRRQLEKKKNQTYEIKKNLLTPFKTNMGFEFTNAQKRVIREIFNGLQNQHSMNRLLLGDVGSGKTVVALSAMLLCIENGYQAAFMAPTEILAEQHFVTIKRYLTNLDVNIAVLTGSTPAKEKKEILQKLSAGEINILIGTHSILEANIIFNNLSLIVIDEQHKFGVGQREKLYEKGSASKTKIVPDMLIMTATPIPRTLALTLYGDQDISTLDEMPPNRQPISTSHTTEEYACNFLKKEIVEYNHQGFIVYPLVDESDKIELKSAVKEWEHLTKEVFTGFKVGLLHGQLPGKQKEKIMTEFSKGEYNVLITTSVIEVGIDVPNATVMIIHHADRFGLATLHQLRGRIGRGKYPSTCFILGDPKTEESVKRFNTFTGTVDGFKIAETDLEIRGPGSFFGTEQHGLLDFRLGNIITDVDLILQARKHSGEILNKDRLLEIPENAELKTRLIAKYSGKFNLPNIR